LSAIKDILQCGIQELLACGIDTAVLEARILLEFVTKFSTEKLLVNNQQQLSLEQIDHYQQLIARRKKLEPIAYIIGQKEFYSLNFIVNKNVLIPRPDSEVLVNTALKYVKEYKFENILELGVGSGCLLLSILYNLPSTTRATAVDISSEAMAITRQNYQQLGLKNQVNFLVQNWGEGLNEHYDLVISNPPYIAKGEISDLQLDVQNYEPKLALDGGNDGLDCYRAITQQLPKLLSINGIALFEIGINQAEPIKAIVESYDFQVIEEVRDLANIIRCLVIKK
jgi:release factor glutamine methyltransferase